MSLQDIEVVKSKEGFDVVFTPMADLKHGGVHHITFHCEDKVAADKLAKALDGVMGVTDLGVQPS